MKFIYLLCDQEFNEDNLIFILDGHYRTKWPKQAFTTSLTPLERTALCVSRAQCASFAGSEQTNRGVSMKDILPTARS